MIVGIGIDIIEIERVKSLCERWGDRGSRKLFTAQELEYCMSRGSSAASLAGRFAAKEAAMKALGVGWGASAGWTDLEIMNDAKGRPDLRITGAAAETARSLHVGRTHVSISHSDSSACAVVILES